MLSGNYTKSVGVLAAAMSFPLSVIRRVMNLPTVLVDMMEKHGTEK
jgi:hypothetical protein